jgi:uracil-DNA glycosylase
LARADLSALRSEISACTVCRDLPLGPRPIVQLSGQAKVLIAGQAPGRITHAKGRPFDDVSGVRLREWLGVDENEFYDPEKFAIVPMGFCYPGTGTSGDLPPRPECAVTWRERVIQSLQQVELTLVIGRYAVDWHLPHLKRQSITQAAQAWQEAWPRQLVLPHPSPRNNRWLKTNPWFERDVLPLLRQRVQALTRG